MASKIRIDSILSEEAIFRFDATTLSKKAVPVDRKKKHYICGVCLSESNKETIDKGLFVFPDNDFRGKFYWICKQCRLNAGFSDDIYKEKTKIGEKAVDEYVSGTQLEQK